MKKKIIMIKKGSALPGAHLQLVHRRARRALEVPSRDMLLLRAQWDRAYCSRIFVCSSAAQAAAWSTDWPDPPAGMTVCPSALQMEVFKPLCRALTKPERLHSSPGKYGMSSGQFSFSQR